MAILDESLVDSFVKSTHDDQPKKTESYVYGTVDRVEYAGKEQLPYVIFDGAVEATPCSTAVSVKDDDRVMVMIKNRRAVVTSNVSSPSVNYDYLYARDALFDGTVQFVWDPPLVDPSDPNPPPSQNVYIGADKDDAPVIIETSTGTMQTDMQAGYILLNNSSTGNYTEVSADGGAWHPSDKRLKTDIGTCNPELALRLRPVSYKFIKTPDEIHYGFIAQEVQEVIPAMVKEGRNGFLSMNFDEMLAPILALVQEQEKRINELERKVSDLEAERDQLSTDQK